MKRESIVYDIIYNFPNVSDEIYKLSDDNLSDRDKYYEYKKLIKMFDNSDDHYDSEYIYFNFVYNLYKNDILSIEDLFNEIFIDPMFVSSRRIISYLNYYYYRIFNSITEYCDFRFKFLKVFKDKYIDDNNEYKEDLLEKIFDIECLDRNIDEGLFDIIKFMTFYNFYSDYEYDNPSVKEFIENDILSINYYLLNNNLSNKFTDYEIKSLFNNIPLDDLLLLYNFFEEIEEYRKILINFKFNENRLKSIVIDISKERGIVNEYNEN